MSKINKAEKPWWRVTPHLSPEEYCRFVEDNLKRIDPDRARRQKEAEEKIVLPFVYKP